MENQSLFEIKLTNKGAAYIRKFARVTVGIGIITLLTSSMVLYSQVNYLIHTLSYDSGIEMPVGLKIGSFISIFLILINFFSIYFYIRFPFQLRTAIKNIDEKGFNDAFRLIYRNSVIYLCILAIDFLNWIRMFFDLDQYG